MAEGLNEAITVVDIDNDDEVVLVDNNNNNNNNNNSNNDNNNITTAAAQQEQQQQQQQQQEKTETEPYRLNTCIPENKNDPQFSSKIYKLKSDRDKRLLMHMVNGDGLKELSWKSIVADLKFEIGKILKRDAKIINIHDDDSRRHKNRVDIDVLLQEKSADGIIWHDDFIAYLVVFSSNVCTHLYEYIKKESNLPLSETLQDNVLDGTKSLLAKEQARVATQTHHQQQQHDGIVRHVEYGADVTCNHNSEVAAVAAGDNNNYVQCNHTFLYPEKIMFSLPRSSPSTEMSKIFYKKHFPVLQNNANNDIHIDDDDEISENNDNNNNNQCLFDIPCFSEQNALEKQRKIRVPEPLDSSLPIAENEAELAAAVYESYSRALLETMLNKIFFVIPYATLGHLASVRIREACQMVRKMEFTIPKVLPCESLCRSLPNGTVGFPEIDIDFKVDSTSGSITPSVWLCTSDRDDTSLRFASTRRQVHFKCTSKRFCLYYGFVPHKMEIYEPPVEPPTPKRKRKRKIKKQNNNDNNNNQGEGGDDEEVEEEEIMAEIVDNDEEPPPPPPPPIPPPKKRGRKPHPTKPLPTVHTTAFMRPEFEYLGLCLLSQGYDIDILHKSLISDIQLAKRKKHRRLTIAQRKAEKKARIKARKKQKRKQNKIKMKQLKEKERRQRHEQREVIRNARAAKKERKEIKKRFKMLSNDQKLKHKMEKKEIILTREIEKEKRSVEREKKRQAIMEKKKLAKEEKRRKKEKKAAQKAKEQREKRNLKKKKHGTVTPESKASVVVEIDQATEKRTERTAKQRARHEVGLAQHAKETEQTTTTPDLETTRTQHAKETGQKTPPIKTAPLQQAVSTKQMEQAAQDQQTKQATATAATAAPPQAQKPAPVGQTTNNVAQVEGTKQNEHSEQTKQTNQTQDSRQTEPVEQQTEHEVVQPAQTMQSQQTKNKSNNNNQTDQDQAMLTALTEQAPGGQTDVTRPTDMSEEDSNKRRKLN